MRLRTIFRPLVKFKVTIMCGSSRNHRKALAITRIATFLDSVVTLCVGERAPHLFQVQFIFYPTLFILVKALPAMRQLHTMQLSAISLAEKNLYGILSSSHLTHLILFAIQMPKIRRFPPPNPNLRKLTLMSMFSWGAVRPLIIYLAASLEFLEFHSCGFEIGPRSWPPLPSFPSLRELRYHQNRYGNETVLDELFRVSQITHMHLSGTLNSSPIAALPKSLQHLSTEDQMLTQRVLGTTPMAQLISLSTWHSERWEMINLESSAFVCDHFPRITSLYLDIPWSLRNVALVMARSQHNVRAMELVIAAEGDLGSEGRWPQNQVETLNDYPRNEMLPGVLQSLRMDLVQYHGKLEWSLAQCTRWIDDDVVHPVTGLGGSDLKSIDVSFVLHHGSGFERERRIWRRWAKLPDGNWRIEGAL